LACLAAFGAGALAGLLAGFSSGPAAFNADTSPAEIVAMRFQAEPSPPQSGDVALAPAQFVLASAGAEEAQAAGLIRSSYPVYAPPPAAGAGNPSLPDPVATAPPLDAANPPLPSAKRMPQPPRAVTASNTVLNSAQIASLRERLKLTSYQEQLWPPVESALREITWRPSREKGAPRNATRSATIDPDSAQVQRLKSAAVPLIMSLTENQKQEVRTMARLMGLDNLASQF
jgi:hypothetical protein